MAIAVELTYRGPGATAEAYKKILSDAGLTLGGSHPDPECLFHWATTVPGGSGSLTSGRRGRSGTRSRQPGCPPRWARRRRTSFEVVNYLT